MHDKKIEKAQINWARRIENYIALIRKDKFKDKDVANLLDDINLSNKPFINNDRIKRYCTTKKGYLLKVLNSSYKSQECIARNLDCFASQISFLPSGGGREFYRYALWTDDLTVPEIMESDANEETYDDVEEEFVDSFENEELEEETEETDGFFIDEEVEDEDEEESDEFFVDEKIENDSNEESVDSFEDEDYL